MEIIDNILNAVALFGESVLFFNITFIAKYKIPFLVAWITFFGIYFSIKFRFINIKYLIKSIKMMISIDIEKKQQKLLQNTQYNLSSSKKILLTGIGEAIDVSAIFGVTTAVIIGGPGVLFWMLVAGLISMPIKFVEVSLGCMTRKFNKKTNSVIGGPSHYIMVMFRCVKQRKLGKIVSAMFSICVIVSTLFSLQINQTMNVVRYIFPFSEKYSFEVSMTFALMIMSIILTGFSMITKITSKIVKIMSIIYIAVCFVIIIRNCNLLPHVIYEIFHQAFTFKAIEGSLIFASIMGLKRIFFSCDIGQGVSSMIHVNTINTNPIQEGIISMSAITIITLISVFCSGLIIVITNSYLFHLDAMSAVIFAFNTVNPYLKYSLFAIVPMFAITTAVAWGYCGQNAWKNIFGIRSVFIYNSILLISYVFCGITKDFRKILDIADIFNFSITFPNIIALGIGSGIVLKRYKKEIAKKSI